MIEIEWKAVFLEVTLFHAIYLKTRQLVKEIKTDSERSCGDWWLSIRIWCLGELTNAPISFINDKLTKYLEDDNYEKDTINYWNNNRKYFTQYFLLIQEIFAVLGYKVKCERCF